VFTNSYMVCVYNWLYRLCLQMVISFVFTNGYFVCVNKWLYRMCLQLVISFVFTIGYIVCVYKWLYRFTCGNYLFNFKIQVYWVMFTSFSTEQT